jgi:hypothetical protein
MRNWLGWMLLMYGPFRYTGDPGSRLGAGACGGPGIGRTGITFSRWEWGWTFKRWFGSASRGDARRSTQEAGLRLTTTGCES